MVWLILGKCIFSCYSSWRLRRAQRKLDRIKVNAYRKSKGLPPIYTFCERVCRRISRFFEPCTNALKRCFIPCAVDYSRVDPRRLGFYQRLWINGTKENYIGKCLAGFIGIAGVLISIILWKSVHADPLKVSSSFSELNLKVFRSQRETSLPAKCMLIAAGFFITTALTFSEACRCVFVLSLLQFFTNKGRAALLAYTLVLALSGPSRNTVTNLEILTESLACGQDLLKASVLDLFSFVSQPFTSFQRAISHVISSLQGVFGRMKDELGTVVEAVKDIVSVIRGVYTSLTNIVDTCNNEFGTPHQRCLKSFEASSASCKEQLGESLEWMCSPVDMFNFLCHFAKVGDAIVCWFPGFLKRHVFEPLVQQFHSFASQFSNFFDARLNITYKLDHELTRDKTLSQVADAMKKDILSKGDWLFQYIGWMDLTLLISMLFVLYKGVSYRWRFLYSDRYDNYYLSSSLIQMDIRRLAARGDSIFPMRKREANLYVETFSWRMVKEEKSARKLALTLVLIASVQILSYLLIDYTLFRFMEWVKLNADVEYKKFNDPALGLTASVEGNGFLAAMYRSILENLNPVNFVLPEMNTTACLPHANEPNYRTYFWIIFLLLVCFMLAVFEPYGLRLRHLICGSIYPDRVIERERWLYIHILTTRDSFLQFAKRKIREKIGFRRKPGWKNKEGRRFRVSCKERLIHKIPILENYFDPNSIKCFVCGSCGHLDDRESFIDCLNCATVFCRECMEDMHDQCVICNRAMYSDAGSESEQDLELEKYNEDA